VASSSDPDGSRIPRPTVKCRGFATFRVPYDKKPPITFNTRYGDVFAWLCAAALLAALLHSMWRWKEKRRAIAEAFGETTPKRDAEEKTTIENNGKGNGRG